MILTCPSCGTQYVVKDGAIPPEGRQVRCASCKHAWHQDPDAAPMASEEILENQAPVSSGDNDIDIGSQKQEGIQAFDMAPDIKADLDVSQDHADQDGVSDENDGPRWFPPAEDEFAPFAQRESSDDAEGRSPLLKILVAVLIIAVVAVAFWFLAPVDLKARLGVAQADESQLQLMLTYRQRQKLASGNDLVVVSGRVINPTDEPQQVPPIEAQVRKSTGEIVYSWVIAPPAPSIPPGGRAPFNSAEMNVPANGELLTVAFAPSKDA